MSSIVVRDWRPINKGGLVGFAKVEMPSGMILSDVTIFTGQNGPWATPPSKPMVGRDGVVMKGDNGKARYSAIIEFNSKEARDRFSTGIIDAIRAAHPGALS